MYVLVASLIGIAVLFSGFHHDYHYISRRFGSTVIRWYPNARGRVHRLSKGEDQEEDGRKIALRIKSAREWKERAEGSETNNSDGGHLREVTRQLRGQAMFQHGAGPSKGGVWHIRRGPIQVFNEIQTSLGCNLRAGSTMARVSLSLSFSERAFKLSPLFRDLTIRNLRKEHLRALRFFSQIASSLGRGLYLR